MSDQIKHTTDASFDQDVLASPLPVLVDFWAEWCGPCKAIAPALAQVADQFAGKVSVVKLDIDANPKTPPAYGIRSIPTLMIFNNGMVDGHKSGIMSKEQIVQFVQEKLAQSTQ